MVTAGIGGGLSQYILRIGASSDASIPRVFGALDRRVRDARRRLMQLDQTSEQLTRQLRQTQKGTDEYRRLEQQLRDVRREARGVTDELGQHSARYEQLSRTARRFGRVATGVFGGLSGLYVGATLGIDRMGESLARMATVAQQTAIPIETLQRWERLSRLQGFDFDPQDVLEVGTRLGEIRDGAIRGERALEGTTQALEALGFDARTIAVRDIPQILDALRRLDDPQLRQFYADDIFSGTGAENYVLSYVTANEDLIRAVDRSTVANDAQAQSIIDARQQILLAQDSAKSMARELLTALAPSIESVTDTMGQLTAGVAGFIRDNPGVVSAVRVAVPALGGLAVAVWGVNLALAAYRALQGPAGWAILGASAALLAAGGIGVAALISRANAQERDRRIRDETIRRAEAAALGQSAGIEVGRGARGGTEAGAYAGIRDALAPEPETPTTPGDEEVRRLDERQRTLDQDFLRREEARVERSLPGDIRQRIGNLTSRIASDEELLTDRHLLESGRRAAERRLRGNRAEREALLDQITDAYRGSVVPNLERQLRDLGEDPAFRPALGFGSGLDFAPPREASPRTSVQNNYSVQFGSVADPAATLRSITDANRYATTQAQGTR